MLKTMLSMAPYTAHDADKQALCLSPSREEQGETPQVAKEQVDPRLLYVISELFPGNHGLDFLARLLRLAKAKQMSLPELGLFEDADVAVISASSLRVLAKLLDLSYDTTEKYVVVFVALHLLHKHRTRQQIILHFPLHCQSLCEPDALDSLLGTRKEKTTPQYRLKVRSFAEGVKRRLIQLRKRGEQPSISTGTMTELCSQTHLLVDSVQLRKCIRQIVEQAVEEERVPALLRDIESALSLCSHRCSRASSTSPCQDADSVAASSPKSRLLGEKGDSLGLPPHETSRHMAPSGDLESASLSKESPSSPKGDSCAASFLPKSPFLEKGLPVSTPSRILCS